MKYLCLIYIEPSMTRENMSPGDAEKLFSEYRDFTEAIVKSGHLVGGNRLLPPSPANTVRVRQGKVTTTDGPYAETKELLVGYYLVEAKDYADAVAIAARIPGARSGHIEVRTIAEDMPTQRA